MRHVIYGWVMSHLTTSSSPAQTLIQYRWRVKSIMNEPCHIHMSHITLMNNSVIYKWVMPRWRMSHVTRKWVMSHRYGYDTYMGVMLHSYESCHIHMCDTCVCDMTHMNATWLICMWHDSYVCEMTYSYVTWLIDVRDITGSIMH